MGLFSEKKEVPTTEEYLKVSLNEVLDRLNKNPGQLQSEEAFANAVITVRNAMINEKLTKWLIGLTAIVATATALLVAVPFITPSLEAKKLESRIDKMQAIQNGMKDELNALKREILELNQTLLDLNNYIQKSQ